MFDSTSRRAKSERHRCVFDEIVDAQRMARGIEDNRDARSAAIRFQRQARSGAIAGARAASLHKRNGVCCG
jgi:hypothetical protein